MGEYLFEFVGVVDKYCKIHVKKVGKFFFENAIFNFCYCTRTLNEFIRLYVIKWSFSFILLIDFNSHTSL